MEASDILSLSPEILLCAILDDAGRIVSNAESEKGKSMNLTADYLLTVKALVIEGLSQTLPRELGNIKFTTVVTDKYRLVTISLGGRTVLLTLPLTTLPDTICEMAMRKFSVAQRR